MCLNDRIAFGVYQALEAAGLRIPADVSVVSFDDSELASWLRPPVTSVGLPEFEMGRLAVETLLAEDAPPAAPAGAHAAAREGLGGAAAGCPGRARVTART